jgi:hypothetical protein
MRLALALALALSGTAQADTSRGNSPARRMKSAAPSSSGPSRTGLKLWLKGDAGMTQAGGTVSAWADQSGNGNDVVAVSVQPIFDSPAANGLPCVRFNNSSMALASSVDLVAIGAARHVIAVTRPVSGGGYDGGGPIINMRSEPSFTLMLALESGFTYVVTNGIDAASIPVDRGVLWNALTVLELSSTGYPGTYTAALNGTTNLISNSATEVDTGSTGGFVVGNRADNGRGQYFSGDICELLVYDHVLSGADVTAARTYLQAKYAIALGAP